MYPVIIYIGKEKTYDVICFIYLRYVELLENVHMSKNINLADLQFKCNDNLKQKWHIDLCYNGVCQDNIKLGVIPYGFHPYGAIFYLCLMSDFIQLLLLLIRSNLTKIIK